jgi:hypothetical protein
MSLTRRFSGAVLWGAMDLHGGQTITWTMLGLPQFEGQPIIATVNGPFQVPALPPQPGAKHGTGTAHGGVQR